MSLDDRLRADLADMARTIDLTVEPALETVLERVARSDRRERMTPRVLAIAAALVLLFGTVAWLLSGREEKVQVTVDPSPPAGTYQAHLAGDLAGTWRIRFGASSMSVVAPDSRPLGTRVTSAPYDVEGDVLTTSILSGGSCSGPGSYRWSGGNRLRFTVVDDVCEVRVRLMTSVQWSPVLGTVLTDGTYLSPRMTPARLRETAVAAGFADREVDELLGTLAEATSVQYTLQISGDSWTLFEARDEDAPAIGWSGPYNVVDAATVVAGEPPCGPITYDYRYDGKHVRFVVVEDECREGGTTVPRGELFAQVTIYQSAAFTRVGP